MNTIEQLKTRAVELRNAKAELKERQRSTPDDPSTHSFHFHVNMGLKYDYRHMHIAYCLLRGTPYEQIEPKVREGNEPNWYTIEKYKKEFENAREASISC